MRKKSPDTNLLKRLGDITGGAAEEESLSQDMWGVFKCMCRLGPTPFDSAQPPSAALHGFTGNKNTNQCDVVWISVAGNRSLGTEFPPLV